MTARCLFSILVAALALLSGCAHRRPTDPPRPDYSPEAMRSALRTFAPVRPQWRSRGADEVAPGFALELRNSADPALNGTFTVGFDGSLRLPYDVRVEVGGRTLGEATAAVNTACARFLRSPRITVAVGERAYWVDVQGLVIKPGQYRIRPDASLDEVIAAAGGLQEGRDGRDGPRYVRISQLGTTGVVLLRDYYSGSVAGLLPPWQGGETIFFQREGGGATGSGGGGVRRDYVKVLGQVRTPGEYPYERTDFLHYLDTAGGPTDRADLGNLSLIRQGPGEVQMSRFTLNEPATLPELRAGDTVIIHADNPSDFEKQTRVWGALAGILTGIGTVLLLALAL